MNHTCVFSNYSCGRRLRYRGRGTHGRLSCHTYYFGDRERHGGVGGSIYLCIETGTPSSGRGSDSKRRSRPSWSHTASAVAECWTYGFESCPTHSSLRLYLDFVRTGRRTKTSSR